MIAGVLLDLDGTLVDHRSAADRAVRAWAADHAGPDRVADVAGAWSRLEGEHFPRYLAGELSFQEQRRRRVAGVLALLGHAAPSDDEADELFTAYLREYEAAWVAYDDAVPTLDALREAGLRVGVLTNGDQDQQRRKLRAVGLLDRLDCVVASSTLWAAKPAPEAFHAACERLGLRPGQVLYVGDDREADAVAATAAGLLGVWLDRDGDQDGGVEVTTVRRLDDVLPLLARSAPLAGPDAVT